MNFPARESRLCLYVTIYLPVLLLAQAVIVLAVGELFATVASPK